MRQNHLVIFGLVRPYFLRDAINILFLSYDAHSGGVVPFTVL